ncbi:MAG: undecaprenyl-diphosphate phosphatase [Candidatus Levybacteria bacterium]|nr:undecaprenyl-diphosphate phosphatase [Candidatus Levybacteria bacterium]
MDYLQAIILSVVEGVSEFLPISSTGHLILASHFLQIPQTNFVKSFEIFIQLGGILAVVVLYWKTFFTNIEGWKKVIAAFIPTAIIGFILYKFIKQFLLGNEYVTIIALFIGGILLIILELLYKEKEHHVATIEHISYKNAFFIGVCQSLAVIPGVSRSAATIIGALYLGTKRKAAVEFSFLLAVPTMLAATILDMTKSSFAFTPYEWSLMTVGFIGSFITAIMAIKFLLQFIKSHTFIPFGIYRIILAILFWVFIIRL